MIGLYEHFQLVLKVAFNDLYWWLFGNHYGWLENLAYVATIAMGLSAVIVGIYAVIQFRHTKKNSNLSFVMDLIDRIHDINVSIDEIGGETTGSDRVEKRLFNLLEAYCGFLRDKSVSGQARKALVALLSEELPALENHEPFKAILANSNGHATRFENIKWFRALHPRKKYFRWF